MILLNEINQAGTDPHNKGNKRTSQSEVLKRKNAPDKSVVLSASKYTVKYMSSLQV